MSKPIQISDIIFPSLATNFSQTLSSLKRSTLSVKNRLRSITEDAEFVCEVADAWDLPLVANERCGSWYIPPHRKARSAYFKSTDGHMGQWSFSLRRLNTQVFDVVGQHGGCVIVDSTRRGKNMPDALMKTVPIWCSVFNRLLFPGVEDSHALYTPPKLVSDSEHSQIESRLETFVKQLKELALDVSELRKKISKPLRPIWITRESRLPETPPKLEAFHPIVLCTASRRVLGGEISEGGYIQGAGDDSEGWSYGLTASMLWSNKEALLSASEEELPELISSYLKGGKNRPQAAHMISIKPTDWLFISSCGAIDGSGILPFDALVTCGPKEEIASLEGFKGKQLYLECGKGKLGSRDLRKQLPRIKTFLENPAPIRRIVVCCPSGKDLSTGVALAILCLYSDTAGKFQLQAQDASIDKSFIKQRLSWIMTSHTAASPSRTTLQSINDFLLTEHIAHAQNSSAVELPREHHSGEKSLPRVLFQTLAGEWIMNRSIVNFQNDGLAGTVSGTAMFASRTPSSEDAEMEYLYRESGIFTASPTTQMTVSRCWIWRLGKSEQAKQEALSNDEPTISVHFVKADGETEDYLYNRLGSFIEEPNTGHSDNRRGKESLFSVLKSTAEHPCKDDFYTSTYMFYLSESPNSTLEKFEVKHEVKGPAKDYISRTGYTRQT